MNFAFDETRAIIAHNAVHVEMRNVIGGRMVPVRPTPPWNYAGSSIPTSPFRLFRGSVQLAITRALAAVTGKERDRLLSLLRMVEGDDPAPVAKAVGIACEEYAVTMQHGAAGWQNYHEFIKPYEAS